MKKLYIILCLIIFGAYANTWPWEIISLDSSPKFKDDGLAQNVSVEQEDLIFDFSSDVNAYKPNIKETFDAKKLFENWASKFKIKNVSYDEYAFTSQKSFFRFSFGQLDKKNVWYVDWSWVNYRADGYDDNLMKITAKYYLKNNSDKEINNKKAFFSPFSDKSRSNALIPSAQGIKKHYYILLNNLTWNLIVSMSGEKISISSKYKTSIEDDKEVGRWMKIITIKPIYEFNISLKPNEQKILQIEYYIPKWYYEGWFGTPSYSYDFAPVFEWKGNNLPLLNLKYIYDKWHRFSYCASNKWVLGNNSYYFEEDQDTKFFDKLSLTSNDKKNIYQAEYTNLKKWDIQQLNFIDFDDTKTIYQDAQFGDQNTCFEGWITWVEVVDDKTVRICFNSEDRQYYPTCENSKTMSKDEFYEKHAKEL